MKAAAIDIAKLSPAQINLLLRHFLELDQVRVRCNDTLLQKLEAHPELTAELATLFNGWVTFNNDVSKASDTEISRILAGPPGDRKRNVH